MRSPFELFLAVIDNGSVSRACDALHMSQPALSRGLQRLEDELGVTLFERSAAGMRPTTHGRALIRYARGIGADMRAAQVEMDNISRGIESRITIGVSGPVASGLMPIATEALAERAATLQIAVVENLTDDLLESVRTREVEFAVCSADPDTLHLELVAEKLFIDTYVAIVGTGHPSLRAKDLEVTDLLVFPWILPQRGAMRLALDAEFVRRGLTPPQPAIETNSVIHQTKAVEGGMFVGFMSMQIAAPAIAAGRIAMVLRDDLTMQRQVSCVWRRDAPLSRSAQLFIETLRGCASVLDVGTARVTDVRNRRGRRKPRSR